MYWGGVTELSPVTNYSDYSNSSGSFSSMTDITSSESVNCEVSPIMYSPDSTVVTHKPASLSKHVGPYLEITEQTKEEFRFRYKSEMVGTHGAIQGINSTGKDKTFPKVRLRNFVGQAIIRCTLNTVDRKSLHVHKLIGKSCGKNREKEDPHDIVVGPENEYTACFQNLVIIHVAKKHLVKELFEKKKRVIQANYPNTWKSLLTSNRLAELEKEAAGETKKMDMNCTILKFEALICENGCYVPLQSCDPVYSNCIKNIKSHAHGQLRICRTDRFEGSCEGGDEIFLLVEKVGKENIAVKMVERNETGDIVWNDYCLFSSSDVHHQFAIVCKTPKYRYTNIRERVKVMMVLERKSDGKTSEGIEFTYLPKKTSSYEMTENNKRRRVTQPVSSAINTRMVDRFPSPQQQYDVTSTTLELSLPNTQTLIQYNIPEDNASSTIFQPYNQVQKQNSVWQQQDYVHLTHDENISTYNIPTTEATAMVTITENTSTDTNLCITNILSSLPTPDISFNEFFTQVINPMEPPNPYHQVFHGSDVVVGDGGQCKIILLNDSDNVSISKKELGETKECVEKKGEGSKKILASDFALVTLYKLNELLHESNKNDVDIQSLPGITNDIDRDLVEKIDKLFLVRTVNGNSALHTAIIYKQVKELRSIIQFLQRHNKTEHINCDNAAFQTPLHLAVSGSGDDVDVEMVNILLEAGADPSKLDNDNNSALHIAVKSNVKEIILSLLESPLIDIDAVSNDGGTVLHAAAEKNQVDLGKLLIEYGADINCINKKNGRTPLHVAVINENIDMINLFLSQKNIQINKEDFNGNKPLELLILNECRPWKKILNQLVKSGATVSRDNKLTRKFCNKNQSEDEKTGMDKESDTDTDIMLAQFFELVIEKP